MWNCWDWKPNETSVAEVQPRLMNTVAAKNLPFVRFTATGDNYQNCDSHWVGAGFFDVRMWLNAQRHRLVVPVSPDEAALSWTLG